ncbi:MAG: hypothetical protein ACR2PL_03785 [Dehalococcoidia bacterium]
MTEPIANALLTVPASTPECVHHWLLIVPDGDEVQGTCRSCGATRAFTNQRRAGTSRWLRTNPPAG